MRSLLHLTLLLVALPIVTYAVPFIEIDLTEVEAGATDFPDWLNEVTETGGRFDAELGWHRTETVDINVLLGGELILVLDKEEVTLHPGDAVIQRNTMHAWKNRTNAPVYWVAVLVPIRQRG